MHDRCDCVADVCRCRIPVHGIRTSHRHHCSCSTRVTGHTTTKCSRSAKMHALIGATAPHLPAVQSGEVSAARPAPVTPTVSIGVSDCAMQAPLSELRGGGVCWLFVAPSPRLRPRPHLHTLLQQIHCMLKDLIARHDDCTRWRITGWRRATTSTGR